MKCKNCGNEINKNSKFCSECGEKVSEIEEVSGEVEEKKEEPVKKDGNRTASIVIGIIALVGDILIIFFPVSFVLSIIGLILAIMACKEVKNVAGIVLNSIALVLSILLISFTIWVISLVPKFINNGTSKIMDLFSEKIEDFDLGNFNLDEFNIDEFDSSDVSEYFKDSDVDINDLFKKFFNKAKEAKEAKDNTL